MGYYVLRCFKKRDASFELMDIFLIPGLGLGISAQIIFYVLLFWGSLAPVLIIQIHLLILCLLFLYNHRYLPKQSSSFSLSSRSIGVLIAILAVVALMATMLALLRPWGDWDGWSFWNYRAHFLFRAGHQWPRLFEFNMQQQHPWMLPLIILWGWCICGSEERIIPVAIGIIFTVASVGLLIGALKKYVSFFWAAIGGIFLASIPLFMFQGTSQYADIVAAYFILLSSVLVVDLLRSPSFNNAALTGLCLGLTASVKDNSIVAVCILLALSILRLYRSKASMFIKPLILGCVTIGVSVVLMKSFETLNVLNDPYGVSLTGIGDWHKWLLMGRFSLTSLTSFSWGGLWPLALAVLIVQRTRWIREEMGVLVQFLIFYIILYFFIFAASTLGLEWLLKVSFDRSLFLLAPVVIFTMFYSVGSKE